MCEERNENILNFVKEFSIKTQLNYYNIKKRKPEILSNKQYVNIIDRKIEILKKKMEENHFFYENYYEITLLINSLVGLLVFPQQSAYDKLGNVNYREFEEKMPTLFRYVTSSDSNIYENTYHNRNNKKFMASNTLRHLRNALSHSRVMIEPVGGNIEGNKKNPITDIIFRDEDGGQNFKLKISVRNKKEGDDYFNDLEKILEELSMTLIDVEK